MKLRERYRRLSPVWRRAFWVGLATVLAFIVIFAIPLASFVATMPSGTPPSTVSTAIAREEEWRPDIEAVGSLTPSQGADLTVEISGVVDRVYFESGRDIRAGTVILRLRDSDETARLAALQAAAELAAASDERNKRLFEIDAISKADLDASAANIKSARAAVLQQQAVVAKKAVTAPFTGRLGIRNVNVGQYVIAGTPVVTLQALDPIHLDFSLPQQTLSRVKVGQAVTVRVDAYPDTRFEGRIAAIDPKVSETTRNFAVRAVLPNKDRRLLPGMYATASIVEGVVNRHITLPQAAITFNPYGSTVYVVTEQEKDGQKTKIAKQTFVTTGATRGDQVAVLTGVKAGDEVVTSGQQKLQNGAAVAVNNSVQPKSETDPRPVDR